MAKVKKVKKIKSKIKKIEPSKKEDEDSQFDLDSDSSELDLSTPTPQEVTTQRATSQIQESGEIPFQGGVEAIADEQAQQPTQQESEESVTRRTYTTFEQGQDQPESRTYEGTERTVSSIKSSATGGRRLIQAQEGTKDAFRPMGAGEGSPTSGELDKSYGYELKEKAKEESSEVRKHHWEA